MHNRVANVCASQHQVGTCDTWRPKLRVMARVSCSALASGLPLFTPEGTRRWLPPLRPDRQLLLASSSKLPSAASAHAQKLCQTLHVLSQSCHMMVCRQSDLAGWSLVNVEPRSACSGHRALTARCSWPPGPSCPRLPLHKITSLSELCIPQSRAATQQSAQPDSAECVLLDMKHQSACCQS